MNYKKLFAVAGVAVVVVVFMAFVVAPNLGSGQRTSFNVVEVYVSSWDLNKTVPTQGIDVEFIISIDFNGDGTFELSRPSPRFNDTTVELAPFKLGGPIASTITSFQFKVEVFRVAANGALEQQLYYTADATVPLNDGINHVDASKSWSFDATGIEGANDNACRISYWYYVNFVA
jgi:hypothetical protein